MDFKVKEILSTTSWVKYDCFRYSRLRSVFTSYFLLLASFIAAIKRTSHSGWPHTLILQAVSQLRHMPFIGMADSIRVGNLQPPATYKELLRTPPT